MSDASFTASELGVSISPSSWTIDPAAIGTQYTQHFTFTNLFGAFNGAATGTSLGSAFKAPARQRPIRYRAGTIRRSSSRSQFRRGRRASTSRSGTRRRRTPISTCSCSTRVGNLVAQSAGSSAHQQVTIANPVAGTYTAVIEDDFAVGGSGTTQYDYSDVYALPNLGAITTNDTAANHPGGSSWSTDAKVTPLGQPGAGRILQGFVQVTSGGAVVGSEEVDLKNVH